MLTSSQRICSDVISVVKRRHRHQEFLAFLRTIDHNVPEGLDIQVVLDHLTTHKPPAVTWLLKHPRFHQHFTSIGSLNLVERFFAANTAELLRRDVHCSVTAREADIRNWIRH